jgi:hypothetical protein
MSESTMHDSGDLAWSLFEELRREILESQRIRAQLIGAKISFTTAAAGLVLANREAVGVELLVVPAFAAIFFDALILTYSAANKRIALYCRRHLEPELRRACSWPENRPLWEESMGATSFAGERTAFGNLGLSGMLVVAGLAEVHLNVTTWLGYVVNALLVALFALDILSHVRLPTTYAELFFLNAKASGGGGR